MVNSVHFKLDIDGRFGTLANHGYPKTHRNDHFEHFEIHQYDRFSFDPSFEDKIANYKLDRKRT